MSNSLCLSDSLNGTIAAMFVQSQSDKSYVQERRIECFLLLNGKILPGVCVFLFQEVVKTCDF